MDSFRQKKADLLRSKGGQPYAALFQRTHTLVEAREAGDDTVVDICGRVMLLRDMGKMAFITLQDHTGRVQLMLREDELGASFYKEALELIDLGDFMGVHGTRFATKKGEPSVLVHTWTMLSKALRQPPEKWHGIAHQEVIATRSIVSNSDRSSFSVSGNFIGMKDLQK
jgi:lysyl-tRNA synthetase class 2